MKSKGKFLKEDRKCFKCGEPGHLAANCKKSGPTPASAKSEGSKPKAPGWSGFLGSLARQVPAPSSSSVESVPPPPSPFNASGLAAGKSAPKFVGPEPDLQEAEFLILTSSVNSEGEPGLADHTCSRTSSNSTDNLIPMNCNSDTQHTAKSSCGLKTGTEHCTHATVRTFGPWVEATSCWLVIAAAQGLVDTGAQTAVIGMRNLQRWMLCLVLGFGYKPLFRPMLRNAGANGVGGQQKAFALCEIPIGFCGIEYFIVIEMALMA